MNYLAYVCSLVAFMVLDSIWIGLVAKSFYAKQIGYIMGPVKWWAVPVFYLVYALALTVFVTSPALEGNWTLLKVFILAVLLGAAAYGAYDFTNQATLKNWPVLMTIVDLAWGMFMTGAVAVITVGLVRLIK
jgi:uncharacterized membrane protein